MNNLLGWSFAALLGAAAAYSAYVGGDAWEGLISVNRFLAAVAPALVALAAGGMTQLVGVRRARSGERGLVLMAAGLGIAVAAWASVAPTRRWTAVAEWALAVAPPGTADNAAAVRMASYVERLTAPGARVAVAAAGTLPYYFAGPCHDLLGKCDAAIARTPMHRGVMHAPGPLEFFPGHLKWDYAYSLGQVKPDVVVSRWNKTRADAQPWLDRLYRELATPDGESVWVLKGSPVVYGAESLRRAD